MRMLGSSARSHPFRALGLFFALMVFGVLLEELIGGAGGLLVRLAVHLPALMPGIAFMWACRR